MLNILFSLAVATQAQVRLSPASEVRLLGELSADRVVDKSAQFLQQIERADINEPELLTLTTFLRDRTWQVSYTGPARINIQAKSGRGVYFVDFPLARQMELPQHVPANRIIETREALQSYVERLVLRLPESSYVRIAKLIANSSSEVLPRFAVTTLEVKRDLRKTMSLSGDVTIDTVTGKVVRVNVRWYHRIESSTVQVSEVNARSLAIAAYRAAVPDHLEATFPENAPGELVYAPPNGGFKGVRYPNEETKRVRLAYQFKVGDDYVWIDAANGNSIGGYGNLALRFETPKPPNP